VPRRFPIHPAAVYGVVKELRAAAEDYRPIVVAGAAGPAGALVEALTADGDPQALRDLGGAELSTYDVEGAGLLLYAVEGEPRPEDEKAFRLADRKGVEVVCVLLGGPAPAVDVAYVLATNVVHVPPPAGSSGPAGAAATRDENENHSHSQQQKEQDQQQHQYAGRLPLERIFRLIAERGDDRGYMWAARLPALRPAVVEQTIEKFSRQNGILGVAVFVPGADMPVLTLNQIRMVFRIAAAYGEEIDRDRALEVLGVIGAGLGFRAVARQALAFVPGVGWAVKGGIAYVGTRALGRAAIAYLEKGGQRRLKELAGSVRSRS
jgi:uncharacterized protein (DUF697 family)